MRVCVCTDQRVIWFSIQTKWNERLACTTRDFQLYNYYVSDRVYMYVVQHTLIHTEQEQEQEQQQELVVLKIIMKKQKQHLYLSELRARGRRSERWEWRERIITISTYIRLKRKCWNSRTHVMGRKKRNTNAKHYQPKTETENFNKNCIRRNWRPNNRPTDNQKGKEEKKREKIK